MNKMNKLLLFIVALLFANVTRAQLIDYNTQLGSTGYIGNNGAGGICFALKNNNSYPVYLKEVKHFNTGSPLTSGITLYKSYTSLSGAPGNITTNPTAWTLVANGVNFTPVAATQNVYITGINDTIQAGVTVRYHLGVVAGTTNYSGTGPGQVSPFIFSNGGVDLLAADYVIAGAVVGYGGPATGPGNFPRGFTGTVTLDVTPAIACAGQVDAGTLTATNAICPNTLFSASCVGATAAANITYVWQSSPDSINFTSIAGLYSSNNLSITDTTYYRVIATCTNSGTIDTSNIIKVNALPFLNCYCNSNFTSLTGTDIGSFTLGPLTQTTSTTPTILNSTAINQYTNYKTLPVRTIFHSTSYPISITQITSNTTIAAAYAKVYLDTNQDGIFDPINEIIYQGQTTTTAGGNILNGFVLLPAGTKLGTTGMRVVLFQGGNATSTVPCSVTLFSGETEDYLINIQAPVGCSGTPNAGNIVSSVNAVGLCPNTELSLGVVNQSNATGLIYQWQTSLDGITWVNNATTESINIFAASVTNTTNYYRAILTCTASALSDTTAVFIVTTAPTVVNCYCASTFTSLTGADIGSFTFGPITQTTSISPIISNTTATATYTNYTALPVKNFMRNVIYPVSVTQITGNTTYGNAYIKAYLDINQSGTFDAGEEILQGGTLNPFTSGNPNSNVITGLYQIPVNATLGLTRLRIVCFQGGTAISTIPCSSTLFSGETEDYLVNIIDSVSCIGAPVVGTVVANKNVTGICPSTNIDFTLNGLVQQLGTAIEWQTSTDSINWTNTGITTSLYTGLSSSAGNDTTYVRARVVCNAGAPTFSNILYIITTANFYNCYCASGFTSLTGSDIGSFIFGNLNQTTSNAPAINNPLSTATYTNYKTLPTTTFFRGLSYPISVTQINSFTTFGAAYAKVFLDINRNGLFETTEEILQGLTVNPTITPNGNIISGSYFIPTTMDTGVTGLRIVMFVGGTAISTVACNPTLFNGETEDYLVNVQIPSFCTGMPNAGILSTSPTNIINVCPSIPISIQTIGQTQLGGIDYIWQTSTDSLTWTTTLDSTPSILTTAPSALNGVIYYRLILRCDSTGQNDTTNNVIKITTAATLVGCYCSSNATSVADEEIFNVTFAGINNTSTCTSLAPGAGSILSQYSNYTTTVAAPVILKGTNNPFSVEIGTCGGNFNNSLAIFIDYNQNGQFTDVGEKVYETGALFINGPNTRTGTILIPTNAVSGITQMRIVSVETGNSSAINPCGTYTWGETEDYIIDLQDPIPCAGLPNAGTLSTSNSINLVCPSVAINLSSVGASNLSGLTYFWQTSSDSLTWTTNTSLTGLFVSITAPSSINDTVYYRLVLRCDSTNQTDTSSNIIKITTALNLNNCYCISNATTATNEDIFNVTFAGINNTSACGILASGPNSIIGQYSNFTNSVAPASALQGVLYPFSVQIGTCGTNINNSSAIFIDYNQNGLFTDVGERVYETGTIAILGPNIRTGSIFIPSTALVGQTIMRVINVGIANSATITPCGTYFRGETEDYLIDIQPGVPCTSPPNPGIITSNLPFEGCDGNSINLNITGFSQAVGITVSWEESVDSLNWINLSDSDFTYEAFFQSPGLYYRVAVSCNGGTPVYTPVIKITTAPIYACYCNTGLGASCTNSISSVVVSGTTLNNPTTCVTGYTLFYPSTPTTTTGLQQAVNYLLTANFIGTVQSGGVWIDFDQSGGLDDYEYFPFTITGSTGTATILVPGTALVGLTGMRIRISDDLPTVATGVNEFRACNNLTAGNGATQDYVIQIDPGVPCSGPPTPGNITANLLSPCANEAVTLTVAGYTLATGINLSWEESTDGGLTWSFIDNTPSIPAFSPGVSGDTIWYRVAVTCGAGVPVYTTTYLLIANPNFYDCYCTSNATSVADEEIFNVTFAGINNTSTCTSLAPGAGSILSQYSNYRNSVPPAIALKGVNYPFSVEVGTCGGNFTNSLVIFIDYNHNGLFNDVGEKVFETGAASLVGPNIRTGNILIPATALSGQTAMRVISVETANSSAINPCGTYTWGETEDYLIIIDSVLCSGAPNPGLISSSIILNPAPCKNTPLNLSVSGVSTATGVNYVWEVSTNAGATWSTVNASFNASTIAITTPLALNDSAYYRVKATCSGADSLSGIMVVKSSTDFINCYCASNSTSVFGQDITSVFLNANGGVSIFNNSTCATTGGVGSLLNQYSDYSNTVTPAIINANQKYYFSASVGTCSASASNVAYKVFIDYNKDGEFGAGETALTSGVGVAPYSYGDSISVPAAVPIGLTRMRVVAQAIPGTNPSLITACGSYIAAGETEDYLIDFVLFTGLNVKTNKSSLSLSAYPNPTTGILSIALNNGNASDLNVKLYNAIGTEVFAKQITKSPNTQVIQIDMSNLSSGNYLIRAIDNNEVKNVRVVLQK